MTLEVGAVAVIVLLLFALVWLTIRAAEALGLRLADDERAAASATSALPTSPAAGAQDRPTPQDAVDGPQDAPAPERASVAPSFATPDLAFSIAALVWWNATRAAGDRAVSEPSATAAETEGDWATAFRASVLDTVPRPVDGPACFGGRDSDAYLTGWDAAVDWIGKGQDAKAPIWGDLAYMTGWYDGVRDVNRARRRQSHLHSRLADA